MKTKKLLFLGALTGLMLSFWSIDTHAQTVLDPQEAAKTLAIRNLTATPSLVSGEVVNRTPHTVRDIELLFQFHWLWKNEFKPGLESPGRTDILNIAKELRPEESMAFRYTPDPPLPHRKDGWFEPEVTIGGFTVVVPAVDMTSR
ncbi:MAG: hypothetical protein ACREQ2_14065 [Candidatus Binatia bacterium]